MPQTYAAPPSYTIYRITRNRNSPVSSFVMNRRIKQVILAHLFLKFSYSPVSQNKSRTVSQPEQKEQNKQEIICRTAYVWGVGSRIRESRGMVIEHSTRCRVIKMIHQDISSFFFNSIGSELPSTEIDFVRVID